MKKLIVILFTLLITVSFADKNEILENIDAAKSNVNSGNYKEAKSDLQMALNAISRMQFEQMKDYLPKAPSGWTEQEVDAADMSSMGMGLVGGLTVSKSYSKGEKNVSIEIVMDSPLIGTLKMFIENPMMASMNPEIKLVRMHGQKVIVEYKEDTKSGSISLIAGTTLISVNGNNVTEGELETFMKAIKVKEILANL